MNSATSEATAYGYRLTFSAGDIIFNEGELGNSAYVVRSGTVEITKGAGDSEVILATLEPGAIFGEMALIDNEPRSASARATSDMECLVFPRSRFSQILAETDPFVRAMLRILVGNMRDSNDSVAHLHIAMEEMRLAPEEADEAKKVEGKPKHRLKIATPADSAPGVTTASPAADQSHTSRIHSRA